MGFKDDDDEYGRFFGLMPVVMIVAVVAGFWWAPPSPKPPANALVFGCYVATTSPDITLDASGMHVKQIGFPAIPYHLERTKTGIALTADEPIRADYTPAGYRFGIDKRGIGWLMPFYQVENGRTYGVFEVSLLKGFQMLATDGKVINYDPAESARCS